MNKLVAILVLYAGSSLYSIGAVAQSTDPIVASRAAAKQASKAYSDRVAAAKRAYDEEVKAAKAERKAANDAATKTKEDALKNNPIKPE